MNPIRLGAMGGAGALSSPVVALALSLYSQFKQVISFAGIKMAIGPKSSEIFRQEISVSLMLGSSI